jgi:ankyrin repeat protein
MMHAAVEAIRTGDVSALSKLLAADPALATARVDGRRTLLHVAADWPGHFPNNVASAALLIAHGADVNAPFVGTHSETPLHWAASCDDVELLDALLDRGADIEASGAVIAGGTPLADAVAFGQWKAARRLIERGAKANLWQAAALGLMDRVEQSAATASSQEITSAFWCACHGAQRTAAEYLLGCGADANWIGYDGLTAIEVAQRSGAVELVAWLEGR